MLGVFLYFSIGNTIDILFFPLTSSETAGGNSAL